MRKENNFTKSYTCELQKVIYKENQNIYPPMDKQELNNYKNYLLLENNLKKLKKHTKKKEFNITPEINDKKNSLQNIIKKDTILTQIYRDDNFILSINGEEKLLKSQILKTEHENYIFSYEDEIILKVRKDVFKINAKNNDNNYLLIMCLNNEQVIYGDEERKKQSHLFDYALYKDQLAKNSITDDEFYIYNLKPLLEFNSFLFKEAIVNNIFFTTKKIREYHYYKQKENAFYHIQAINLPFNNFEFYWITK